MIVRVRGNVKDILNPLFLTLEPPDYPVIKRKDKLKFDLFEKFGH